MARPDNLLEYRVVGNGVSILKPNWRKELAGCQFDKSMWQESGFARHSGVIARMEDAAQVGRNLLSNRGIERSGLGWDPWHIECSK